MIIICIIFLCIVGVLSFIDDDNICEIEKDAIEYCLKDYYGDKRWGDYKNENN